MEKAQKEIFIADWWLCPQLFIRRGEGRWLRLWQLLQQKAQEGVMIYILMFKVRVGYRVAWTLFLLLLLLPTGVA